MLVVHHLPLLVVLLAVCAIILYQPGTTAGDNKIRDVSNTFRSRQKSCGLHRDWNNTALQTGNKTKCPLWFVEHNGQCKCGDQLGGVIACNEYLQVVFIRRCYCMTYGVNESGPFVGACLYNCYSLNHTKRYPNITSSNYISNFIPLPQHASDLNNVMCDVWKRKGQLCGECKDGYAPQVYSFDFRCVPCDPADVYINLIKYGLAAFVGPTVFLLLLLCLGIRLTTAKLNAFIFVSQCIATPVVITATLAELESRTCIAPPYILTLAQVIFAFYGIWNLDFFRTLLPSICLNINTRQALGLDFIVAFYPLVFLSILYILIRLYDRNCRVVVYLWKPFHVCFARCRRVWNIKTSVVHTFAAFVILSYTKTLNTVFTTFLPTQLYSVSGKEHGTLYSYYDPSVPLFDKKHFPYCICGAVLFFLINIVPILLLCLYPTRCGRRCLTWCRIRGTVLQTFSDAFQGYYSDGTNGTRDFRFFPAVYLLTRVILFIAYSFTLTGYFYFVATTYLICLVIFILILQPYKAAFAKYLKIDALLILVLALFFGSLGGVLLAQDKEQEFILPTVVVCTIFGLIPLIYITAILVWWCRKVALRVCYESTVHI